MAPAPTDSAVAVRLTPYIPHVPHEKQQAFLWLNCLEALYGGAAGGGKSDALLMAALQYVDLPGYAALLLRRTYPELSMPGGLLDRSKLWLSNTDAHWSGDEKAWKFPSGAKLVFGYAQTYADLLRYYGSEWQFIGWDELTQFPEDWYRLLFSRLRKPQEGPLAQIPLRMRGASNPGGIGNAWVKRRFITREPDPADPKDNESKAKGRIFIPARLPDNPSLDREQYERALDEVDPQTRAQLLDGDWDAREPGNWAFEAEAIQAVEEAGRILDEEGAPDPVDSMLAAGVDWGDFATHAVPIWGLERGGIYVPPLEVASSRQDVEDITKAILAMIGRYDWWFGECRYDASFKQSQRTFARIAENKFGPHNPIRKTGRPNTYPVAFGNYKTLAVKYLRLLMRRTLNGEATRILAISPQNTELLRQLRAYQEDEFGRFQKGDDDAVDALIAGVAPVARAHREMVEDLIPA